MIALTTLLNKDDRAAEGGIGYIESLLNNRVPFLVLSEASSYARSQLAQKLSDAGYPLLKPERFYTSTLAAIDWIAREYPQNIRAAAFGGQGLKVELRHAGFERDDSHPSWVFLGIDRHAAYEDYNEALRMIRNGAVPVCLDSSRVTYRNGQAQIGAGAIGQMLAYASGRQPIYFGRPSVLTVANALNYTGYQPSEAVFVGNDFDNDIIPALRCKLDTVYVAEEASIYDTNMNENVHPKWIVENLAGLAH
jgi:4-nitrophenyl phosphatase